MWVGHSHRKPAAQQESGSWEFSNLLLSVERKRKVGSPPDIFQARDIPLPHDAHDHVPRTPHAVIDPNAPVAAPRDAYSATESPLQVLVCMAQPLVVADGVLGDAVSLQRNVRECWRSAHVEVAPQDFPRHGDCFGVGREGRAVCPVVPAKHDSDLRACGRVVVRVEDDAEGALGVHGGVGDEVTEAADREEVWGWEKEVYDEDSDEGDCR